MNYEKNMASAKPGIYIIVNIINYKCYVGSSINVKNRIQAHIAALIRGNHNNKHLQRAYNKYGIDNFDLDVILYCHNDELIFREQEFIDKLQAFTKGYNNCPIANNTLGFKFTEEQKKKMSKSSKGQKAWNKGLHGIYSEKTRKLMGVNKLGKPAWNKGIPRTEEEKQKMSNNRKGGSSWNKGIKIYSHVGEIIAEANRNRIWKEETKQKMSKMRKGKKLSIQHCGAISEGLKGHKISEETKQKISNTLKHK